MNRNRSITILLTILIIAMALIAEPVMADSNEKNPSLSVYREDLDAWFVESPDSVWSNEEVELVNTALFNTIKALEDAGFDSHTLLKGYRFRRMQGEFVDGVDGRIALVRHHNQEIILSDTAFLRLQGYYIYHELGHVVDKRMDRKLSRQFHNSTGSTGISSTQKTADGFWLNEHARLDQQEATADAFALWVVMNYTDNYKPVFWNTPYTVDYAVIVSTMENVIQQAK